MKKRGSKLSLSIILMLSLTITLIPVYQDYNSYAETSLSVSSSVTIEPDFVIPVTPLTEVPVGYVGVYDKEGLNNIRDNLGWNYILMNDIVFDDVDFQFGGTFYNNGKHWLPIGNNTAPFTGMFDGNGYQVVNVKLSQLTGDPKIVTAGFFGCTSTTSSVKNLAITNGSIVTKQDSGLGYVGGIVGCSQGLIDNCVYTGSIDTATINTLDGNGTGGIVGVSMGPVSNCFFDGTIAAQAHSDVWILTCGGIAGSVNYAKVISNCRNAGDISGTLTGPGANDSNCFVGGIVGNAPGTVKHCMNTGQIKSTVAGIGYSRAGGIVGGYGHAAINEGSGEVNGCFNNGRITATATIAGGRAYASGISGNAILNSYNTGIVTATAPNNQSWAGGLVAYLVKSITGCYDSGAISAHNVGSLIAAKNSTSAVTNSYYLQNSATGTTKNLSGTPLTATQMNIAASYTGFDFSNIWAFNSVLKLPILKANPPTLATSIRAVASQYDVAQGGVIQIKPEIVPSNAVSNIIYKSMNTLVATISQDGTVTGNNIGSTTITVADSNTGLTAACTINVRQGINALELSGSKTVDVGKSIQIITVIMPTTPYDNTILWSSNDEEIATVNSLGQVTGIKAGNATIYASAQLGIATSQNIPYQIEVIQHPQSIALENETMTLSIGESQSLKATVLPEDTKNKNILWQSSNENVVTVDTLGNLTPLTKGNAIVTATTVDGGFTDTCSVDVIQSVESVFISFDNLPMAEYTIEQGSELQLLSQILPDNANNQKVTWYSNNETVLNVDQTGRVTTLSEGVAVVTLVTEDGAKTDTCVIIVGNQLTGTLEINSDKLMDGDPIDFTQTELSVPLLSLFMASDKLTSGFALASVEPTILSKPQWTSSDTTIATVDKYGYVHGTGVGPITITAYATDSGRVTASKEVTIIRDFAITYILNGGTNAVGAPVKYTYDTGCTLPTAVKAGYDFGGWFAASNLTGTSVSSISTTDKGDKTLYAKWIPHTYIVKFNANGGTGTMASIGMTYNAVKALPANTFGKTGYSFAGWATSPTGSLTYANQAAVKNLTATNNGVFTLYAKWTPNTYTIKFNINGGTSGTMSSLAMTYDSSKALTANAFKKTGYSFLGWAITSTGAVAYKDLGAVKNLTATKGATINLYAKWGAPITSATSYNYTSIKVSWAYSGSATSYKIYRATSATGTYSYVYTASSTARSWVDTGQTTGKYYYYKVYPVAGGKTYTHSTYKYAKAIPTTPTVTLTKASTTSIKITWTGVSGATKYQVYRAISATGTYSLVYTASSTLRSWTNTGLSSGKTYYYKVRAYHLEGTTKVYGSTSAVKYLKL